jgi:hypothetical protein
MTRLSSSAGLAEGVHAGEVWNGDLRRIRQIRGRGNQRPDLSGDFSLCAGSAAMKLIESARSTRT